MESQYASLQKNGSSGEFKAGKINERHTVATCNLRNNYKARETAGTYKAEGLVR
jgi:hypothetical protein